MGLAMSVQGRGTACRGAVARAKWDGQEHYRGFLVVDPRDSRCCDEAFWSHRRVNLWGARRQSPVAKWRQISQHLMDTEGRPPSLCARPRARSESTSDDAHAEGARFDTPAGPGPAGPVAGPRVRWRARVTSLRSRFRAAGNTQRGGRASEDPSDVAGAGPGSPGKQTAGQRPRLRRPRPVGGRPGARLMMAIPLPVSQWHMRARWHDQHAAVLRPGVGSRPWSKTVVSVWYKVPHRSGSPSSGPGPCDGHGAQTPPAGF